MYGIEIKITEFEPSDTTSNSTRILAWASATNTELAPLIDLVSSIGYATRSMLGLDNKNPV